MRFFLVPPSIVGEDDDWEQALIAEYLAMQEEQKQQTNTKSS